MTPRLILEDFGPRPAPGIDSGPAATVTDPQEPADPAAAFEAAYKAGYDDAQAEMAAEAARIDAEFARNLQELSFTFHEARQQVSESLRPLVQALIGQVMPGLLRHGLADQVFEVLEPIIDRMNTPNLVLRCATEDMAILQGLLVETSGLPVTLSPEPSLMHGQLTFAIGHETHSFDVSRLQSDITDLVRGHFEALALPSQPKDLANVG